MGCKRPAEQIELSRQFRFEYFGILDSGLRQKFYRMWWLHKLRGVATKNSLAAHFKINEVRDMEQITLGKRYRLSSLQCEGSSSNSNSGDLITLQYVFKPSSVDPNHIGSLSISNTHEALITLPTRDKETVKENFKGIATKPSNEFILSFYGGNFQLERVVSAVTNIRHSRNESAFSIKDTTIASSRKLREQSLLLRSGPRSAKRKRPTKLDAVKSTIKDPTTLSAGNDVILISEIPSLINNNCSK